MLLCKKHTDEQRKIGVDCDKTSDIQIFLKASINLLSRPPLSVFLTTEHLAKEYTETVFQSVLNGSRQLNLTVDFSKVRLS